MFLVGLATVVRLCFTSDIVLLIDWLYCIDLFSCIAASLFNKLTYLLTYLSWLAAARTRFGSVQFVCCEHVLTATHALIGVGLYWVGRVVCTRNRDGWRAKTGKKRRRLSTLSGLTVIWSSAALSLSITRTTQRQRRELSRKCTVSYGVPFPPT